MGQPCLGACHQALFLRPEHPKLPGTGWPAFSLDGHGRERPHGGLECRGLLQEDLKVSLDAALVSE